MNVPPGSLTRKQVAHRLGKSVRSVLRLDETGVLHPVRDAAGNVTYARAEVDALLNARGISATTAPSPTKATYSPGALTAKVFRELRAGKTLLDVTIDCQLTPAVAEDAAKAFARIADALLIIGKERERLRAILPRTADTAGLVRAFEYALTRIDELARFSFPCARCGEPVQARSNVEWARLLDEGVMQHWTHDRC